MTKNEIVGRLRDGGLDASSANRSAAVYVADAREGRADAGWFVCRIICDSDATERRARAILSRWYDIEASGNVWRLRSKNRVPLMAIKRGGVPPTPPTVDYMYFEAVEPNSTVSMISLLTTAPNLEYSRDGETWQEWQHTTADGVHTFDTITLGAVGDRVYFRGVNPNGYSDYANEVFSMFSMTGKISAGGNAQTLVDGDNPTLVAKTMPRFSDTDFSGEPNTSLVSAPSLPATTLAFACYLAMFSGCEALTASPELPATTMADYCYVSMFNNCTLLTAAPSLPATTLANHCYGSMFIDCTSLTTAPSLPATTLADYCYENMFAGCTSLETAPALLATTLANGCYSSMFSYCTSLTSAPSLPATTLANRCYSNMFEGCTSLTTAPSLPATTLADYCYWWMFAYCTSLTSAPSLPANTLANYCYESMFSGCTFAMSNDGTTFNFNCAATLPQTVGEETFNTPYELAVWMENTNGFIDGDYLYLKNVSNENGVFKMVKEGSPTYIPNLEYSLDGVTWTTYNFSTLPEVTVAPASNIYFRGTNANNQFNKDNFDYVYFSFNKTCEAYGNVCSLFNPDPAVFSNITSIGENGLVGCFFDMTTLTKAPNFGNVTSIGEYGLHSCFGGCISLISGPDLSRITSVGDSGLELCFSGCEMLTQGPDFSGLTSVGVSGLALCFAYCNKIGDVTAPNVQDLTQNYILDSWLDGAGDQATGTTVVRVPTGATIETDSVSGIPTGWTRVDY